MSVVVKTTGSYQWTTVLQNLAVSGTVNAPSQFLILSSSAGSTVYVSGALVVGAITGSTDISQPAGSSGYPRSTLKVCRQNGLFGLTIEGQDAIQADLIMYVSGGTQDQKTVQQVVNSGKYLLRGLTDALGVTCNALSFDLTNYRVGIGKGLTAPLTDFHVSGSTARFSNGASNNVEIDPLEASLTAVNQHLVLSSSAGSIIRLSGALTVDQRTTAALPANSVPLTGTIVWDSTRKTMKIYGPMGWCPILTGAAG